MLILSRKTFLLIAFSGFIIYFLLFKLQFLFGCDYTVGKIISFRSGYKINNPLVEFYTKNERIRFVGDPSFDDYENKEVSVVYKKANPREAKIFSFFGFWWNGILYSFFPLILFAAFILSFVAKGEFLVLDYSRFFKKPEDRQPFRLKMKKNEDEVS